MSEFMFEVRKNGPMETLVRNGEPTIHQLFTEVKKRVGAYDLETLAFNVDCVVDYIKAGRVINPDTFQGWIDALVREYNANLRSFLGY